MIFLEENGIDSLEIGYSDDGEVLVVCCEKKLVFVDCSSGTQFRRSDFEFDECDASGKKRIAFCDTEK